MSSQTIAYVIIGLMICLFGGWALARGYNKRLKRRRGRHGDYERINLFGQRATAACAVADRAGPASTRPAMSRGGANIRSAREVDNVSERA